MAVVGVGLLVIGMYVALGSVETDAPPEQRCTGSAAWRWTQTDLEPCHTDALDQFIGGVVIAAIAAGMLAVAVGIERGKRRPAPAPLAGPPARDNVETVRSLQRLGRRSAFLVVIGVLLLAAFATAATTLADRARSLSETASTTEGTVVRGDRPWYLDVWSDTVTVEYTVDEERRTATVYLNDSSPSYSIGDEVQILYLAADPSRSTIDGEENDPPEVVWPMIVALAAGAVALGAGALSARRVRALRRWAAGSQWTPDRVQFFVVSGNRDLWLMQLPGGAIMKVVGIRQRDVFALLPSVPANGVTVWLAGTDIDGMAVAAPGGRVLAGAVPARSSRQRDRWTGLVENADADDVEGPGSTRAARWWRRSNV